MRIDEIDLYGGILINGSTGSEGQILTYDTNGGFAWGTASGGSGGPTSSYFKTSGYNYVICETVNTNNPGTDALTNGTNLENAYESAKTLDVGTKSATNRVVVLLMPGDYDLGDTGQFQLDTSFIDLVGISSNPYDTILRSSTQFATLQYTIAVDSALKNVHLKQGTTLSIDDDSGNGDGSYLRWENLILSGNTFHDGSVYGFTNIYGEFKNIKVLDNCYSFVSDGIIDGIFDNIEVGDNAYAFYTVGGSNIGGTYSNIEIGDNTFAFQAGSGISGRYENINSGLSTPVFLAGSNISGYFENIKTTSDCFSTSPSGNITGTFKNLNLSITGNAFLAYYEMSGVFENIYLNTLDGTQVVFVSGLTFSGTFSNINIGDVNQSFFAQNNNSLSGSFKDITIGNVSDLVFKSLVGIDGTYENITIGNVTNDVFKTTDMISGSFKNITIGDITNNNAFYADSASGQINGTFDEIQIGNIASTTGNFFSCGATMSGTFSNIEIGDASEWATSGIYMFSLSSSGSIIGSYKNIKVGSTSFLFYPAGQDLNGTFENIEFGSTVYAFYTNTGSIFGTYSNIKSFSPQERVFTSSTDLIGTFEDIEFSNSITISVFNAPNSLSGTFKNIKLGYISTITQDIFYSGATDLTGTFENIEVGNGNSSYDIFKSGGNIIGTFSNITVGSGWNYAFSANAGSGGISGYFKDIYISALVTDYGFYGASVSSTTIIDNLWCDNRFYAGLGGKLLNSSIFGFNVGPGWALDIQSDGTIIENCKIIGRVEGPPEYGIYSTTGAKSNVQILYTALYKDVEVATITLITPNYNIIEITT
jgi:hypothetical protein